MLFLLDTSISLSLLKYLLKWLILTIKFLQCFLSFTNQLTCEWHNKTNTAFIRVSGLKLWALELVTAIALFCFTGCTPQHYIFCHFNNNWCDLKSVGATFMKGSIIIGEYSTCRPSYSPSRRIWAKGFRLHPCYIWSPPSLMVLLEQGWDTYSLRATCSPWVILVQPAMTPEKTIKQMSMCNLARFVGMAYNKNHNSFSFHSGKKVTNLCSRRTNTCLNNLTFFANSVNRTFCQHLKFVQFGKSYQLYWIVQLSSVMSSYTSLNISFF